MIVLIPAFQPGPALADLVRELHAAAPGATVVVVDDGSGPEYDPAFQAARAEDADVIRYDRNRGKGHALRTGLRHVLESHPGHDVVTADCDGQHETRDILRVADRLATSDAPIVLGGRRFTGRVPTRSRLGNAVSRRAFALATGCAVHDTQTGLRGFREEVLPWLLTITGDRFDYELSMLLESSTAGMRIEEIPIETIYLEQNASSHFRPVIDSLLVLRPLVVFALVSLASFVVDVVALELMFLLTSSLLLSVLGARAVSGATNFLLNRRVVFPGGRERLARQASRYLALAIGLVVASFALISALTTAGLPLLAAKVTTDVALYLVSFQVQRRLVFRGRRDIATPVRAPADAVTADKVHSCTGARDQR